MTAARYRICVLSADQDAWATELRSAAESELLALGLHRAVSLDFDDEVLDAEVPSVAVFLGSAMAAASEPLRQRVREALGMGIAVYPVVADLGAFAETVPDELQAINGVEWAGEDPARRIARLLLEEIGIEDKQRRVFISHKREDGLGAAEQLHDRLTHVGFRPFIDRFAIRTGQDVQEYIADALEDHAFLLLLETPLAHTSDWVYDEVDYALSHAMGILIVQWPDEPPPVPASDRLPRLALSREDLTRDDHEYDRLTETALDRLIGEIEGAHAYGIVRRRRALTRSVEEAALAGGCDSCTPHPSWRLLVEHAEGSTLVGVAPRLPTADDLQHLDQARDRQGRDTAAMLVHSARALKPVLREHLSWVTGDRALTLLPENAVGGSWR